MTRFPRLLSPLKLGSLELPNRIIFGPHATGHETDPAAYGAYLSERAKGGAQLIITSLVSVHPSGYLSEDYLRLHGEEDLSHIQKIITAVKGAGSAVFLEMGHMGRSAGTFKKSGIRKYSWGPSEGRISGVAGNTVAQPMPLDLIDEVVQAHATAASLAMHAGADGIELYASHDGLLGSFLAEKVNSRSDQYGGSVENRFRIVARTIAAIRAAVGRRFPFGIRISGDDCDNLGLTAEEALEYCIQINQLGSVDFIEVTRGGEGTLRGLLTAIAPMTDPDGAGAVCARPIKAHVDIPVIANGRINQPQVAEAILTRGDADAVCLVRPLICDAHYIRKVVHGAAEEIRACIGCNQACIGHEAAGAPLSCIQNPESGRELLFTPRSAARPQRYLVVGGGPAGMKAAIEAAYQGHDVQLCEAAGRLGGQVLVAQSLPGREEFGGLVTNLQSELSRTKVQLRLGCRVDASLITSYGPDVLVIATGGKPFLPSLDMDHVQLLSAWEFLTGGHPVGQRVIVVDEVGDWVAPGVAELLARRGCSVSIATIHASLGKAVNFGGEYASGRMFELRVPVVTFARLFGAADRTVVFEHVMALEPIEFESIDTVVFCGGMRADRSFADSLGSTRYPVHVIGDCASPRTAEEAVFEGFLVGRGQAKGL